MDGQEVLIRHRADRPAVRPFRAALFVCVLGSRYTGDSTAMQMEMTLPTGRALVRLVDGVMYLAMPGMTPEGKYLKLDTNDPNSPFGNLGGGHKSAPKKKPAPTPTPSVSPSSTPTPTPTPTPTDQPTEAPSEPITPTPTPTPEPSATPTG